MNPVVHFEMPYHDQKRMIEFYEKTFGWQTKLMGPEMGDYVLAGTADTGEDMMPKERGCINGGFFETTSDNAYPSVVISVDDIYEAMKKVEAAGGKVLPGQSGQPGEPDDIPGVGLYAAIIDTEGNRVSLLQSHQM